jgi:serine/threonine protein kinase
MALNGLVTSDMTELLAHDYYHLSVIGQGAFGIVFKGIRRTTGAERAVKVIRADARMLATLSAPTRPTTPAAALGIGDTFAIGLQHPYLAVVHDVVVLDRHEQLLAIAMEYIAGRPLARALFLERRRQIHESDVKHALLASGFVARVVACMLSALEFCGRRGIVHQDIKPDNILVCGERGVPCKLIDFGLANVVRNGAYMLGMGGTAAYLAPEKFRQEAFGTRADVFSLGMVVYEMVTLSLPDSDPAERAHSRENVTLPVSAPIVYRRMVADMLQSSPSHRPSAAAVSGRFQMTDEFRLHCRGQVQMMSGIGALEQMLVAIYDGIEYLGGGAFGHVFKGRHKIVDGLWAIKMVEDGGRVGERLLMDVRHEHLMRVHHIGTLSNTDSRWMCIQMELVAGQPLRAVIEEATLAVMESAVNPLVESGSAWWMMRALLKALVCLEQAGIIHEDIKPENIMVDVNTRLLKVIDFGLSVTLCDVERRGQGGTRMYSAPEKLRGDLSYTCKADVYSAGAVMWEMVMLRPLVSCDADALTRAREYRDSSLECSHAEWSDAVTEMLTSHPESRTAASTLAHRDSLVSDRLTQSRSAAVEASAAQHADAMAELQARIAVLEADNALLRSRCAALTLVQNVVGFVVSTSNSTIPVSLAGAPRVTTISEAVRLATSGMTVHILAGTYRERVVVDKDIVVIGYLADGSPAPVDSGIQVAQEIPFGVHLVGTDAGPALTVWGCKAIIRGLKINHPSHRINAVELVGWCGVFESCDVSGQGSERGMGGVMCSNGRGIIRACRMLECGRSGLVVNGGGDVAVERCVFMRNAMSGVLVKDTSKVQLQGCRSCENEWSGLVSWDESRAIIERCIFMLNKKNGIDAQGSSSGQAVQCECSNNGESGMTAQHWSHYSAEDCSLLNNGAYGAERSPDAVLVLSNCVVAMNALGDRYGV